MKFIKSLLISCLLSFVPYITCVTSKRYIIEFKNIWKNISPSIGTFSLYNWIESINNHIIVVESNYDLTQMENNIFQSNDILNIEEDFVVKTTFLNDEKQTNPPWNLAMLTGDYKIYDYSNSLNSTVYIIDTGIDIKHKEFEGRAIWGNNFVDNIDSDCNGHGTHVAGTVGSKTYGINKYVKLVAVKVLDCKGSGYLSGIIKSIDWVIQQHGYSKDKSVINMSFGGAGYSDIFQKAITKASEKGIYIIVAAGNESQDACNTYPAGYTNVISVGAVDENKNYAYFSNKGKCVHILAPGVEVLSTYKGGTTRSFSGTSMSSPHVAGVTSLYCNRGYSYSQLFKMLQKISLKEEISKVPDDTLNYLLHITY